MVRLRYYLQYCAINSSLNKRSNALTAAKKAHKLGTAHLTCFVKDPKKYVGQHLRDMSKILVLKHLIESKTFIDSEIKKDELIALMWSVWQSDCTQVRH